MIRLPVSSPPVKETRSTRGSSLSGAPACGPAPSTRLATPAGTPASSSRPISRIAVCGVSSLGLSTKVLPGGQAGRDLPGGLQQRVVPRRDQAAHADRLVHDAADHVGLAGVDHPTGVLRRDVAVVVEHADHVVDVVLALDEALAGVERLGAGDRGLVARQQVGDAVQQRAALERRAARPVTVVEGVARGADRGRGCPRGRPRRSRPPATRPRGSGSRGARRREHWSIVPRRRAAARCGVRSVRDELRMSQLVVLSATELRVRPVPSST